MNTSHYTWNKKGFRICQVSFACVKCRVRFFKESFWFLFWANVSNIFFLCMCVYLSVIRFILFHLSFLGCTVHKLCACEQALATHVWRHVHDAPIMIGSCGKLSVSGASSVCHQCIFDLSTVYHRTKCQQCIFGLMTVYLWFLHASWSVNGASVVC